MAWVLAAAIATGVTGDFRIAVVALIFLARMALRGEISRGTGIALAVLAALFCAYGRTSIEGIRRDIRSVHDQSRRSEGPVAVEGWVCRFPYYRYGGVAFDLRTRMGAGEQTIFVQSREFLLGYGDSVRVTGAWKAPDDLPFEQWSGRLLAMGVTGEFRAFPGGVERLSGCGGGWPSRRVFYPCHDAVRQALCRGLGSRSGIPVALVIGERGYLDRRATAAFRALGISHLLALSGLHLGFVAAALLLVMRLLRRRAPAAMLAALALYVAVVGPIISLYRAFVMAALLITASMVRRPLSPLTALAHAFVIVLLLYPFSFYSVAFQLSFMATFAVLLAVRNMGPCASRCLAGRALYWVRSSLRVSVAAQVFVAPVIIHYFGVVSLLAPISTLVFVMPVALLLLGSVLSSVLFMVLPPAGFLGLAVLDRAATLFQRTLIEAAAALPGPVPLSAPNPWLYYGGLGIFAAAGRRVGLKVAGIVVLALSFAAGAVGRELS